MLRIKPGVKLSGLRPEIIPAMIVADRVYGTFGVDAVITSGLDGEHMEGSKHYEGKALDFRTFTLQPGQGKLVAEKLAWALSDEFDVINEGDHIHVEFDP